MSSDGPIYILIDATPEVGSMKRDHTGTYRSILEANKYIPHLGPPLPIVVQCLPHQEHNLDELKRLVKGVPGTGNNARARRYVNEVIELIQDLEIWATTPKFYACIGGADMPKYVCQDWEYISDLRSGDTAKTPSFSTFIHAFVYALAGGDFRLRQWGLYDRWSWIPRNVPGATQSRVSQSQPPPRSPLPGPGPSRSQQPQATVGGPSARAALPIRGTTPSTPVRTLKYIPSMPRTSEYSTQAETPYRSGEQAASGASDDKTLDDDTPPQSPLRSKGKQRATPLPVRATDPLLQSPAALSSQHKVANSPGIPSTSNVESALNEVFSAPQFCSPATLIPPSIFSHPRHAGHSLPCICKRSPHHPGVGDLRWSGDLAVHDDTLFLPAITTLPPFVEFALRAMGWDDGVLRVVDVAASSQGSRDAFILILARAGIPMAEGYLVWELLRRTPNAM